MEKDKKPSIAYRTIMHLLQKSKTESNFIYLGEKIKEPTIILCNHVGTSAPLSFELFSDLDFRFWGTHEMNSGLKSLYKYQSRVFYHEKKNWNLTAARLFCLIAAPVTNTIYKGLDLISTYQDFRFKETLRETLKAIQQGYSIVIFPEDSKNGYLDELEGFHKGFTYLLAYLTKQNIDVPVLNSYYNEKNFVHIIDKPIKASILLETYPNKQDLADAMCKRCNELGVISRSPELVKKDN